MKLNYLQFPVVRGMGVGTLKKTRAANKKAAFDLPKNLKDPEFKAATKIMKYKKRQYYG
jgi:hypothetical protein